ncbi:GDSL-type esterase/lipase family protein [Brevibacillus ginsengisoli]|uniref:GDSL-type esterase/lipase family protein n=1 Tax=Brevibacillus ginsengisoli TaxID=363854 RepID=UPI003CF2C1B6
MRPPQGKRVNRSHLLWRSVGILALLSFLILLTGFGLSLHPETLAPAKPQLPESGNTNPSAKPAPLPTGTLNIVSLGDSLTRGTGDADGLGYIGRLRQSLEKEKKQPITLTNLGINGLKSAGLLDQLNQSQVQKLLAQANIITFTIGGNDLFQSSDTLQQLDKKKIEQATLALRKNYTQILQKLHQYNPNATIIYIGLYNPFGDTEAAADTAGPVIAWNYEASQIAANYNHVLVVPTYDLFYQKERQYLYTDHFHPNSDGYARIAERILRALQ